MASRNNRGRGRGLGGDRGRSGLRGAGVVRRSTRAVGTGGRGRGSRNTPEAIQTTANTEQSEFLFGADASQTTAGDHEDRTAGSSPALSRPVYTSELPELSRPRFLEWQAGNAGALELGVVLLTTMIDVFAGRGPPPRSGSGEGNGRVQHFDHEERVLQKTRAFIVVHKSEDVFTALPIYTYQGRGMEGKSERIQAFHLHVNDGRRLGGDLCATLDAERNDSQELYAIMHGTERENSLLKESAWCKFNYPQTMSLENKKVKILGKLTKFSARKIFMRHYQHVFDVVTFPQPTVVEELEDAENAEHPADNDGSADDIAAGESTAPFTGQVLQDASIHGEAAHSTTENPAIVSAATQSSDPNIIEASGYLLTSLANAVEATRSLAASFKIGPSTQATPQTSPTLGIANLRLKSSPGKRSAEDDDNRRSLERVSKRQNRLSGLVELSSTGRLRSVPQSRRNSGKDEGKNHHETDTTGIEGVPAKDEMSTNAETDTTQPPETQTSPTAPSDNIARSIADQNHTHSHNPTEDTKASTSQSVENTRPEKLDDSGISPDEIQDVIDIHANAEEPQEIERHRAIQILKSSNHAILSILRA